MIAMMATVAAGQTGRSDRLSDSRVKRRKQDRKRHRPDDRCKKRHREQIAKHGTENEAQSQRDIRNGLAGERTASNMACF
jgi:hypothetical protein